MRHIEYRPQTNSSPGHHSRFYTFLSSASQPTVPQSKPPLNIQPCKISATREEKSSLNEDDPTNNTTDLMLCWLLTIDIYHVHTVWHLRSQSDSLSEIWRGSSSWLLLQPFEVGAKLNIVDAHFASCWEFDRTWCFGFKASMMMEMIERGGAEKTQLML